ncbi:MAG: radical SAM protein [Acidobacteria bacterium]|nr:radical SAM protein [Acidobacteriota bacterium]
MQAVFGPVPSRRLGRSLGIDPIPLKTCNWNCVYCQLGRTSHVVNERKEWVPESLVLEQAGRALERHTAGEIDWITFVGSGEPTLHSGLGRLIRGVKRMTSIPVAVITNGALLHRADVREELSAADAVLPSLDAGSDRLYRLINRPHSGLTFERQIQGLIAFRERYEGRLWLEIMLLEGVNDGEEALRDLARAVSMIEPDAIHIDVPSRPPAESWVRPAPEEGLIRASAILGDAARVLHPSEGSFDLGGYDNVVDAVIGIITRHPMRADQLERSLARWSPGQVREALAQLEADGRAQVVKRYGVRFWTVVGARYVERERGRPDDA